MWFPLFNPSNVPPKIDEDLDAREHFEKYGFVLIYDMVPFVEELRSLPELYVPGHDEYDYDGSHKKRFDNSFQVEGATSRSGFPLYNRLHKQLGIHIGKLINKTLFPTYTHDRVYYAGTELTRHNDWEACEYSVTLQIETTLKESWPICFDGGYNVHLKNGDGVIYKGCDLWHWRDKMPGNDKDYHHQLFLHYVETGGECYNKLVDGGKLGYRY